MSGVGHRRPAGEERGFTLLELLVVMVILALCLTLVVPGPSRVRLGVMARTTGYELAANLRAVRAAARSTNVEHALTIDVTGHRYWAEGVVAPRQLPRTVAVELTVPESERIGPGASRVRFFPDGSTSGARLVFNDGRSSASVLVDWLSGDVRLEAKLSFLLAFLKPRIEREIDEQFDKYFAAPAAKKPAAKKAAPAKKRT